MPDPGSAFKNLSILTQKNGFYALVGNMIRIPDLGVKKAPDPGSGSLIRIDP
jgi:hypothetical protein